jgi:hypothetical protein
MGKTSSLADYFEGYGWACAISLLLMSSILWFLSGSSFKSQGEFRILCTMAVSLLAWSVVEFLFFFPFAAGLTLAAALLTLASSVRVAREI